MSPLFSEMVNHLFEADNSSSHSPRLLFSFSDGRDCDVASFDGVGRLTWTFRRSKANIWEIFSH